MGETDEKIHASSGQEGRGKKQVARTKSKRSRVKPIDFAKTPTLSTFSLRTKLVKHGSRNDHLAETKNLSMQVRVYSPHEGPNGLHCSPYMDHSFVVLEGTARFHGPRGEVWDIGRHEGVMIPAGAFYCFENFGDDVLVIMRAASLTAVAAIPTFGSVPRRTFHIDLAKESSSCRSHRQRPVF